MSGASQRSVAQKFGLSRDAVHRHARRHISAEYRAAVKIGPYRSESELRRLVSENSASVVENLLSVYQGLAARWLSCYEAGSDQLLVLLTKEMHRNLSLRAQISKELGGAPSMVVNNIFSLPPVIELERTLLRVLAEFPEARAKVVKELRALEAQSSGEIIEVAADATPAAA